MKKVFVSLFVITVFISLFASCAVFAQSPSWAPEPGTMAYANWFAATGGHPGFSISENGWFESSPSGWSESPSGLGNSNFNTAGIVTGAPVPSWAPQPGTMEYAEWFSATGGQSGNINFNGTGVSVFGGGSSFDGADWFEGSPSGWGDTGG